MSLGYSRQWLFPALKFNCSGFVLKWLLAANDTGLTSTVDRELPRVQLYRQSEHVLNAFVLSDSTSGTGFELHQTANGVYEYVLQEPWPVEEGDLLGLLLPSQNVSQLDIIGVKGTEGASVGYCLSVEGFDPVIVLISQSQQKSILPLEMPVMGNVMCVCMVSDLCSCTHQVHTGDNCISCSTSYNHVQFILPPAPFPYRS